jgi:hypothetical protein
VLDSIHSRETGHSDFRFFIASLPLQTNAGIVPGLGHEFRYLPVGLKKLKWKNEGTIPKIESIILIVLS